MVTGLTEHLECLYMRYNKREYVDPDPLLFVYDYSQKKDREIAGFIAACFAYGRVDQIMKIVGHVLGLLCPSPFDYLMTRTKKDMAADFKGFRYRFAGETHLVALLWAIRKVLKDFSSLENCFDEGTAPSDDTILPGLVFLSDQMNKDRAMGHLLADPNKKSACKRSLLFLRWMIRKDRVDPGGWEASSPARLIVPLDTHMYKAGRMLDFTRRKAMDLKTALEITQGFRQISRQDPVKYDFSLTRFGIRKDLSMDHLRTIVCG